VRVVGITPARVPVIVAGVLSILLTMTHGAVSAMIENNNLINTQECLNLTESGFNVPLGIKEKFKFFCGKIFVGGKNEINFLSK
jgi:hypothetical protein